MTEQQFEVFQECEYLEEWSSCPYCIKYDGETVFETLPLGIAKEVCKKLDEQQSTIQSLNEQNKKLKKRLKKCANNWKQEIVERGKLEEEVEQLKIIGVINNVLYE